MAYGGEPAIVGSGCQDVFLLLTQAGYQRVLCILAVAALENAVQSGDLSEPALARIFDAHRQLIELRAAQKLNAGRLEPDGSVLVGADDI